MDNIIYSINVSEQSSLKACPFTLYTGRTPIDPLIVRWRINDTDINPVDYVKEWENAIKEMDKSWKVRNKVMQKRRSPVTFEVGELVIVKSQIKSSLAKRINKSLSAKFIGPKEIIRFLTPNTVVLLDPVNGRKSSSHVSLLKEYHSADTKETPKEDVSQNNS